MINTVKQFFINLKNCFTVFVIDLHQDHYKENSYSRDIAYNSASDVSNFGNPLEIP